MSFGLEGPKDGKGVLKEDISIRSSSTEQGKRTSTLRSIASFRLDVTFIFD